MSKNPGGLLHGGHGRERVWSRSAFTLVELMAAIAVLSVILALVFVIIQQGQQNTLVVTRILQAQATGRVVLDKIEQDLLSMGTSAGLTLVVGQSPDGLNDAMALLCSSRPVDTDPNYSNMRLTAVYYAIQPNATAAAGSGNTPALVRGFGPLNWDSTGADPNTALVDIANDASSSGSSVATDHDPMGEGVVRFAILLELQDGTRMPNNITQSDFPKSTTFTRPLPSKYVAIDLSKVKAVTISLAILDPQTRSLAAQDLSPIAQQFLTPTYSSVPGSPTPSPGTLWRAALSQTAFNAFPAPVRQYTQFVERTIQLH